MRRGQFFLFLGTMALAAGPGQVSFAYCGLPHGDEGEGGSGQVKTASTSEESGPSDIVTLRNVDNPDSINPDLLAFGGPGVPQNFAFQSQDTTTPPTTPPPDTRRRNIVGGRYAIEELDEQGNPITDTYYSQDGEVTARFERNPATGEMEQKPVPQKGPAASEVRLDPETGNPLERRTYYDKEKGKMRSDTQFDPRESGHRVWQTDYNEDGSVKSHTVYQSDGKTPLERTDYHPDGTATLNFFQQGTGELIESTAVSTGRTGVPSVSPSGSPSGESQAAPAPPDP